MHALLTGVLVQSLLSDELDLGATRAHAAPHRIALALTDLRDAL